MPKFAVHVVLGFVDIEADSLDDACDLAEMRCSPITSDLKSIRSYGERCQDGEKEETQGLESLRRTDSQAGPGSEGGVG